MLLTEAIACSLTTIKQFPIEIYTLEAHEKLRAKSSNTLLHIINLRDTHDGFYGGNDDDTFAFAIRGALFTMVHVYVQCAMCIGGLN